MKKLLFFLVIGVIFLLISHILDEKGSQMVSKETIRNLKSLCNNYDTISGEVNGNYQEITMEIGALRTKMYEFTYNFKVNENNYSAKYSSLKDSVSSICKVWYDKTNPNNNSTKDPFKELENNKNKTVGNEYGYLSGCIIFLLLGIGFIWNTIINLIRFLIKRKQK